MAERIVDRVRGWIGEGRTRLEAFQELRNQGYGEAVAERIVEEASVGSGVIGRKKLLLLTAILLLVLGTGVAFAVLTFIPADGGDGGDTPPQDSDTGSGAPAEAFTTILDRTPAASYHVEYTFPESTVAPGLDIRGADIYRQDGTVRKAIQVAQDGTDARFDTYAPAGTGAVILCGPLNPDGEPTCLLDHAYLFIAALTVSDPLVLTEVDPQAVRTGEAVRRLGRPCTRFTVNTSTHTLYTPLRGQPVDIAFPGNRAVRMTACLDNDAGYTASLLLEELNGTNDGSRLNMSATFHNATVRAAMLEPPLPVAVDADCSAGNATATILPLQHTSAATLSVDGTRHTVPLPDRYASSTYPLPDTSISTNTTVTVTAAGQNVSTTCTPPS